MAGKTAKNRKQAVLDKIKALARAREINNLLAKGALQSEALQNASSAHRNDSRLRAFEMCTIEHPNPC